MSIDLAIRLGRVFDMDGTTFVRMQEAVDVWETLNKYGAQYEKIKPVTKGSFETFEGKEQSSKVKK